MESRNVEDARSRLETLEYRTVADATSDPNLLIDGFVVDGARIILTRNGAEVAALVHPDDAYVLREAEDRMDNAAAAEALAEVAENGTITWEQYEADVVAVDMVR